MSIRSLELKILHNSDYAERREAEYPSIAEQLDMLWHAMDKGTAEKMEPFYSSIKAVKENYPKCPAAN